MVLQTCKSTLNNRAMVSRCLRDPVSWCPGDPLSPCSGIPIVGILNYSGVSVFRCSGVPVSRSSASPINGTNQHDLRTQTLLVALYDVLDVFQGVVLVHVGQ